MTSRGQGKGGKRLGNNNCNSPPTDEVQIAPKQLFRSKGKTPSSLYSPG